MLKPSTKSASTGQSSRPESPSSVQGILYPKPNVTPSLERTINATKALFSNPLSNIPDQIKSTGALRNTTRKNSGFKLLGVIFFF